MKAFEACLYKLAFDSEEAAKQNGMTVYMCIYCGKFHRAIPKEVKEAHNWNHKWHDRCVRKNLMKRRLA